MLKKFKNNSFFKKLYKDKYKEYIAQSIRYVSFSELGIIPNDDFYLNITNHIKTLNDWKEFENELNKLAFYIYDGRRTIFFHEFRQFPYINHKKNDRNDICGYATNYTRSDIYLIKFIREFMNCKKGRYRFFNVDYIIKNTIKMKFDDYSIMDMPIDEILR